MIPKFSSAAAASPYAAMRVGVVSRLTSWPRSSVQVHGPLGLGVAEGGSSVLTAGSQQAGHGRDSKGAAEQAAAGEVPYR